jgi:hypothetical protein
MNSQTLLKKSTETKKRIRHPPENDARSLRNWWCAHGCRQSRRCVPCPWCTCPACSCREQSVSEPGVVLDLVFYLCMSPARNPNRAGSSSSPSTNHRSSALNACRTTIQISGSPSAGSRAYGGPCVEQVQPLSRVTHHSHSTSGVSA